MAHIDPSESDAIAVMLSCAIGTEGPFLESFRDCVNIVPLEVPTISIPLD